MKSVNPSPIWISGLGSVSCAGLTPQSLWANAKEEKSGIVNGLGAIPKDTISHLKEEFLKNYPQYRGSIFAETPILLSVIALKQAMDQAGWTGLEPDDGIVFATTTGHVSTWDEELMGYFKNPEREGKFTEAFTYERLGLMLDRLCEFLQFDGNRFLITTACSASTHALALAKMWMESGRVKRCLVGGTEILSRLTIEGFKSFQLLSDKGCRPFDQSRNGINLSEGSGFLCLERSPVKKLAQLSGAGMSTDAHHMTAPHPEGRGSFQAMTLAVKSAGIQAKDLSWIHAHGTGSVHNDLAESIAIETLVGNSKVPVTSTKAVHGHALAATGVLETVLCVKAIEHQMVLPTVGLVSQDPAIRIHSVKSATHLEVNHILKNTLGFGGANGAVIISRPGALA